MREARGWMALNNKILRKPDPMQIFVSGVNNDVGRISGVNSFNGIKLTHSTYSTIRSMPYSGLSILRSLWPLFFLSLPSFLPMMRSMAKRNGEHCNWHSPTLYRAAVYPGKVHRFLAWVGHPASSSNVAFFAAVAGVECTDVRDHWLKLISLFGAALMYLTFFIALGIFLSTTTKRSSVSFLFSLVLWFASFSLFRVPEQRLPDRSSMFRPLQKLKGSEKHSAKTDGRSMNR